MKDDHSEETFKRLSKGESEYDYDDGRWIRIKKIKKRFEINVPGFKKCNVMFNPIVVTVSSIFMTLFLIFYMLDPKYPIFQNVLSWILQEVLCRWSWFFYLTSISSTALSIYFLFSRFGRFKLGKPGDVPEFDTLTWMMMIFICGSTGLRRGAAEEPIKIYGLQAITENTALYDHKHVENIVLQEAHKSHADAVLFHTFFSWGFQGWSFYASIAIAMGFMSHRKGLPFAARYILYPLLGDRLNGFVGDVVDIITVCCGILSEVACTWSEVWMLNQMVIGFGGCETKYDEEHCNEEDECQWLEFTKNCKHKCVSLETKKDCDASFGDKEKLKCYWDEELGFCDTIDVLPTSNRGLLIATIWLVCGGASVGVLFGIRYGFKHAAYGVSMLSILFLTFFVFVDRARWDFPGVFWNQVSLYLNYWFVGPISILWPSHGAYDVHRHVHNHGEPAHSHGRQLYQHWTAENIKSGTERSVTRIFPFLYSGWAAWGLHVGMFVARISKGRTVREVIVATVITPALLSFCWISVLSHMSLQAETDAEAIGLTGVQSPVYVNDITTPLSEETICENKAYDCLYVSRLSQRRSIILDLTRQYSSWGRDLVSVQFIILNYVQLVASMIAASWSIGQQCAYGLEERSIPAQLFITLQMTALITIVGLKNHSTPVFDFLEVATFINGIVLIFIEIIMVGSLFLALQYETGQRIWATKGFFHTHLMDVWDIKFKKSWLKIMGRHCAIIIFPLYFLYKPVVFTSKKTENKITIITWIVLWTAFYYTGMSFSIGATFNEGFVVFAFGSFAIILMMLVFFRYRYRRVRKIDGSLVLDLCASCTVPLSVVDQMYLDAQYYSEQVSKQEEVTPLFSVKFRSEQTAHSSGFDFANAHDIVPDRTRTQSSYQPTSPKLKSPKKFFSRRQEKSVIQKTKSEGSKKTFTIQVLEPDE